MYRYLLKIAFDGTSYHGWQVQANAVTVQLTLQNGLEKFLSSRPDITGCSRTDAGVHAKEYFCHFDLQNNIPADAVVRGLNSVLPDDIRALECNIVSSDFHSRYSALGKEYIYTIDTSKIMSPFSCRYAYHYSGQVDVDKMNEFCSKIVGERDFAGFSSSKRSTEDTVRTVYSCTAEKYGDIIKIRITGNGFLYNMVRIVAGTALAFGTGRFDLSEIDEIINSKDRSLAGNTLAAKGLTLNKVYYTGDFKDAQL